MNCNEAAVSSTVEAEEAMSSDALTRRSDLSGYLKQDKILG